jgi:hypothetical protein
MGPASMALAFSRYGPCSAVRGRPSAPGRIHDPSATATQMNQLLPARAARALAVTVLVGASLSTPAAAQKDYYKLDKNRPSRISDAYTTERYAIDVKVAPLRLERESGGVYHWEFEPEVAYGILPRTSVEIGLPFAIVDAGPAGRRSGVAGLDLSAFHTLNVETRTLPAMAIRADVVLPVGSLAPDRAHPSMTGLVTRTFSWARFHVNGQYGFGPAPAEPVHGGEPLAPVTGKEASRWLAGVAVDRVFPLRALLLVGNVYARQPLHDDDPLEWSAGAGFRYQVNPYLVVDSGLERRLTGDPAWQFTVGAAYQFALRALVPVPR